MFTRKSWPLIFVSFVFTLFIAVNVFFLFRFKDESPSINEPLDSSVEQMARFDGVTWLWEKNDKENIDGFLFTKYLLSSIDENGKKTVLYQTEQEDIFGDFAWGFNETGSRVAISDIAGGSEGAGYTHVVFEKDREVFRVVYGSYGPYVQGLTFKTPNSSEYEISLQITETCSFKDVGNNTSTDLVTELVGINIVSTDNQQNFPLLKPVIVPCDVVDGTVHSPTILGQNIRVNTWGIDIELPGGERASVSFDETKNQMEVVYF